jgi:hypothetical protein
MLLMTAREAPIKDWVYIYRPREITRWPSSSFHSGPREPHSFPHTHPFSSITSRQPKKTSKFFREKHCFGSSIKILFVLLVAAVRSTNHHRPVSTSSNNHHPVPSSTKSPRPSTSTYDGSENQSATGHYRGITFEEILPSHLITNAPPPAIEQRQKRGSVRLSKLPPPAAAERSPLPVQASAPVRDRSPPSIKRSYPTTVKRSGENKSRLRNTVHSLIRGFTFSKRQSRGGRTDGYERYS